MKNFMNLTRQSIKVSIDSFAEKFRLKYPKSYRVFSILKNGTNRFSKETILYFKLKRMLSENRTKIDSLTWNEVEIIRQIPKDWKAVAPVMIIAAFPFANYIVLPLAYIYPQKLLCKQFWTIGQQLKFGEENFLKRTTACHTPLLDHLSIAFEKKLINETNARNFSLDLIQKTKQNEAISFNEILELRSILNKPEFALNKLTEPHLKCLVQFNDCNRIFNWSKLKNLIHYAYWLNQADQKLLNEELEKIQFEYIYNFSFERGLNANAYSVEDLIKYLKVWLKFSNKLDIPSKLENKQNDFTLFLHAKIFLSSSCKGNYKMLEK